MIANVARLEHWDGTERRSIGRAGTTVVPEIGAPGNVVRISRRDAAKWSQSLVHKAQGQGCEVKEIARAADCSPDAIKKIADGSRAFSLTTLVNLLRASGYEWMQPELRRLMAMDANLDPELQRGLAAYTQAYYAQRAGQGS